MSLDVQVMRGVNGGSFGQVDCESGGISGNLSPAEVLENSVSMSESEIGKGDSGSGVVVVGESDDDEFGNRGAGRCSEGEEKSRDLGGSCESKEEVDESGSRRVLADASKEDAQAVTNDSFVIDIKPQRRIGESIDREKLCRICHLSSEQGLDANASKVAEKGNLAGNYTAELILLGCRCKEELGMAHRHCAEAWFKLKRNRLCEICGETAKNVSGVGDNRFMEEWNDSRGLAGANISSSESVGCWRRQPFCNFLTACLVMAFVLPWFFRVDLI